MNKKQQCLNDPLAWTMHWVGLRPRKNVLRLKFDLWPDIDKMHWRRREHVLHYVII